MAQKRPFLGAELAKERAKWLEVAQKLLQVMHICCTVVLSYLHTSFVPQYPRKKVSCVFLLLAVACSCLLACLLLPKYVAHPWTLRRGVKPRHGMPTQVLKTYDQDRDGS